MRRGTVTKGNFQGLRKHRSLLVLALWKAGAHATDLHELKHIVLQCFKPELWKRDLILLILSLGDQAASCAHNCLVYRLPCPSFCDCREGLLVWAFSGFVFWMDTIWLAGMCQITKSYSPRALSYLLRQRITHSLTGRTALFSQFFNTRPRACSPCLLQFLPASCQFQ